MESHRCVKIMHNPPPSFPLTENRVAPATTTYLLIAASNLISDQQRRAENDILAVAGVIPYRAHPLGGWKDDDSLPPAVVSATVRSLPTGQRCRQHCCPPRHECRQRSHRIRLAFAAQSGTDRFILFACLFCFVWIVKRRDRGVGG